MSESISKLPLIIETVKIVEIYLNSVRDEVIDALYHRDFNPSHKVLISIYVESAIRRLNELKEMIEKL
jgi:hypothetical protein